MRAKSDKFHTSFAGACQGALPEGDAVLTQGHATRLQLLSITARARARRLVLLSIN